MQPPKLDHWLNGNSLPCVKSDSIQKRTYVISVEIDHPARVFEEITRQLLVVCRLYSAMKGKSAYSY